MNDFDSWRPVTRYFPSWEEHLEVVGQDMSVLEGPPGTLPSPGQRRHLIAADGRVWTHLRKAEPDPSFLERVVRSGCPLYVFQGPCPDAAEVAPAVAGDFWLAHRARLDDQVGLIEEAGEWRADPAKDARAFMFEDQKTKARLVLMEFGMC